MNEIGIFGLPRKDMTFMEALDYVKSVGATALEPFPSQEFASPNPEAARRLKDAAREKGVSLCCFSMMADLTREDNADEIARLKGYADTAAAMGSPFLHHTLAPGLDFSWAALPFKVLTERVAKAVREVYDYAEQQGVRCVYEDQGFQFNGCERFEDFLAAVNRPVGVVADLGNILFVDETAEAFVGRFAPFIVHVHAKDYLSKQGEQDVPDAHWYRTRSGGYLRGTVVGHGVVHFERALGILAGAGYTGAYSLEFDGLEDIVLAHTQGIANLRRYLERAEALHGRNGHRGVGIG